MTNELKPCPFCGGEAELWRQFGWDRLPLGYVAGCCSCGVQTWVCDTKEQALETWNTRAERTCRFIDDCDGEFPPKCSACGYEPSIYECSWLSDGGYEFEGNYCPNCGAKVIDKVVD